MNCCAAALKPIPASRKLTSFRYYYSGNSTAPVSIDLGDVSTETQAKEIFCSVPVKSVFDPRFVDSEDHPCFWMEGEANDIKIRNGVVLIS